MAGNIPAADLRPQHTITLKMTHHLARAIKRLSRWASEEDFIPKDSFSRMAVPACGERTRTLTRAEAVRLYKASPRGLRRFLFVMLHTLARPGEIRLLTWSQIDLQKRTIELREFKAKSKRKDGVRVRIIALDARVLRLLSSIARNRNVQPGDRLFRSTANAVRCAMRRARLKAGLDDGGERVVCYTMRHTSATNANSNGIELKLLAELMGHARTSTTERYVHVSGDRLVSVIDRATAKPKV